MIDHSFFIYLAAMIGITVAVAVFICRFRVAHGRSVSYGTVFAAPMLANMAAVLGLAFYQVGSLIFTLQYWRELLARHGVGVAFTYLGLVTVVCFLPAMGVVHYYQRRSKRDETRAA